MGTSAHSELGYAFSSTGDVHFVRRSDKPSQRRFVTKLDFARADSTPAPKPAGLSLGSPSFSILFLKTNKLEKYLVVA